MKNIQIIDGARNCVYDIFQATDEEFESIFPDGQDIAFLEDVTKRLGPSWTGRVFGGLLDRPIAKRDVVGIHGVLFEQLEEKKQFYPTLRDAEAINPDGSKLRA